MFRKSHLAKKKSEFDGVLANTGAQLKLLRQNLLKKPAFFVYLLSIIIPNYSVDKMSSIF